MSVFNPNQYLVIIRRRINETLGNFFRREIRTAQHPLGKRLLKAIGEYTLRRGAKRTRGTLAILGYLSNPRNTLSEDILKIAAAYELLHAYLLVHDDIIDQDVVRRGGPTLHKAFEHLAPTGMAKKGREKIGSDIAIIAGDIAADLVQRCVLSARFSIRQKVAALEAIERTLHTTYIGQVLDILALPEKVPPLDQQLLRYQLKTAVYTIESPFMLGVRLGRARIAEKAFHAFARDAGVAFQLADDVQNVFSRGLAGRSSDIRHGKITLLISYALHSTRYRHLLVKLLGKKEKTARDLARIRECIIASGGYRHATEVLRRLYRQAERRIPGLRLPEHVEKCCRAVLGGLQKLTAL